MAIYKLTFFAAGIEVTNYVNRDVIYGKSSFCYKHVVDEEISKWLLINKLNAKSTKILDIILINESEQRVYFQGNYSDVSSIAHIDFDEKTNSELIGIKIEKA